MATTTYETLRDEQIVIVHALTPASFSGVPFLVNLDEIDFRSWALANPVSLRRFSVVDLMDYDLPDVASSDLAFVTGQQELVVAYPNDHRYGTNNRRDQMDIIREDMRQIDDSIGIYGYGSYTNGHLRDGAISIEDAGPVMFGVLTHTFSFYRSPNT